MRRSKNLGITPEEQVAIKMSKLLSDFHLDLEAVGFYLSRTMPYTIYRRFLEVSESAQYREKEVMHKSLNEIMDTLF
jgi:hypothetical protein